MLGGLLGGAMSANSTRRLGMAVAVALVFSAVQALPASSGAATGGRSTADILEELGGEPCPDGSAFTCVTLAMPLDHFDTADTRTLEVVFAVLPATGARRGTFVVATGGPGSSGVAAADAYVSAFDPRLPEQFDIVLFDQRGVGGSGDVDCAESAATWYGSDQQAVTPEQELDLKDSARTFVQDCMEESGPSANALLPYLGTDQAVEDLEQFRRLLQDERFWLYGESYGTQYAETYAAAHGDHLVGLVLDGTVDLTVGGTDYFADQARAYGDALLASLQTCNDDPICVPELDGDAVGVYDRLVARLRDGDISYRFPRPSGGFDTRQLSLADLELSATSQTYTEADRMLFTRALATWASHQDLVPLARLVYSALHLDPETLDVVPDPTFSDAMYFAVDCRDYSYPGDGPEQKAENYIRAGDEVEASVPRLASAFNNELPCAYWPGAGGQLDRPEPLTAEGIPTFVLNGTADPATPYHQAVDVYRRLDDGYLITKTGGSHVIFGLGDECVDGPVTEFLLSGRLPAQRETTCDGVVAEEYIPLAPEAARDFQDHLDALISADVEVNLLPEYLYWDGAEPTRVGCPAGGTLNFAFDGATEAFSFSRCSFTRNFSFTGAGTYTVEDGVFAMNVSTDGRWDCQLHYRRTVDEVSVDGPCK